MDYIKVKKPKHSDERGQLVKFLTRKELAKNVPLGHIYFVTFAKKGVVRGNHYHHKKDEYFGITYGRIKLIIEDVKTKKRKSFILNADSPQFVRIKIGPNIAHAVESLSSKAVLIDYFPLFYNLNNPNNHPYILIKPKK